MEEEFVISEKRIKKFVVYLTEEERSKATIEKYQRDMKKFQRFLGEGVTITKEKVLEYKDQLLKRYSVNSVNSMLAALNQYLQYIGAYTLKVKRIKIQQTAFRNEEKEMTEQEYKCMVNKAYQKGNRRLALIMETVCATGIRISELKYFTMEAVKEGNQIQIYNKGKVRVILLPDKLRKKLLCYIGEKGIIHGNIFVTSTGKPVDRSNIWREMKQLGVDAGIVEKKVYPHNLRHLFATLYYRAYKDLIGLADILGHTNVETTRIYTITTSKECQERMERLRLII